MQGLRNMLLQEEKYLEEILDKAKQGLAAVPDGYLRISKDKAKLRYYHCTNDRYGIYISKKNVELPIRLAQKSYDMSVVKKVEKRLCQIKKITKDYSDDEIEQLYTSLHNERQLLVTPIEPTWKQTVTKWYEEKYQGKEFQEGTTVILTEKGERVRSKSEKILADFFYQRKILYKYEKPLYLRGYGTVYPDFTFLSKKLGQEIYWEHEGMIDRQEYARTAVRKIESYQKNGIYPGERLILTFETAQSVLNSKNIEELAKKYLDWEPVVSFEEGIGNTIAYFDKKLRNNL